MRVLSTTRRKHILVHQENGMKNERKDQTATRQINETPETDNKEKFCSKYKNKQDKSFS